MANLPDKEKVVRNFSRCLNWEDKYLYVIELGAKLPMLPAEERLPEYLLSGCQSQVWLLLSQNAEGGITFRGDSDAAIVKGLLAVVFVLYQGLTPEQVLDVDYRAFFSELALTQHLTPSRTQGLDAMIRAVRQQAANLQ